MRSVFCVLMCLFLFGNAGAVKIVNSRSVPEKEDFSSFGDAYQFNLYDTILTEMLPIMPSGRNGDGIDVDSIRGNPDIDSISGNPVIDSLSIGYIAIDSIRGNPDLDSVNVGYTYTDTIRGNPDLDSISGDPVLTGGLDADSLKLGTAWVTDVYMIDDTNDTLVVKQGGKTWKFDVLADQ